MESTGTAIKIYYCCSSAFNLQGNVKMYQKNNSSGNLYQMKKHYHHTDFTLVRSQLLLSKLSKVISNGHQQLQLQPLHSCSCHFLTSVYVWHSYVESTKKHFEKIFDHQSVLKADNQDWQYHRGRWSFFCNNPIRSKIIDYLSPTSKMNHWSL